MALQKVNVKLFAENREELPLPHFIEVFNSWIQRSDGDYYDLADYSHMHTGPGIILVSHAVNISVDETGNRRGLLYNQKGLLNGSNRENLRRIFRLALENCRKLEKESSLQGRLRFVGNEALVIINDRLLAPNTPETFDAVKLDLEEFARELYAGTAFTLEHCNDRRQRFSVLLRGEGEFDVSKLLKNLEQAESSH